MQAGTARASDDKNQAPAARKRKSPELYAINGYPSEVINAVDGFIKSWPRMHETPLPLEAGFLHGGLPV